MSANTTDHSAQHDATAQSSKEESGSNKDTKKVLLIGDSNLNWLKYTRGLQDTIVPTRPGQTLKDISRELDTTDLQSYSHAVVQAGTNDLTELDDEQDIANIEKEAERLCTIVKDKHPRVKLALSGICPRADRALPAAKVDPANAALRRVADEWRVLYVDNEGSFQYRNGQLDESLYDRDRLHISRRRGASRLVSNINEVVPILPTRSRMQQPRRIPGEPPCHF
ncbi:Hypp8760 [Branchiostoma lanceolatum]|uniref:1-alkyl-2-acetylglycerophosphocholine esterase n=1 Tax=Branchiostoma lanceolatum TaxID=7740 RepID=A0A8J9Z9D0_BRALA|nr:Hypp8760 [Branchiostoma lanceolatum]